ncbi:hypothetical protein HMPREF3152_00705 [Actinomyces sp. HMSC06A08]|nr:hypothetical protein HMPREF3152_00705 [Actinomyces sp. HMSC06A08]
MKHLPRALNRFLLFLLAALLLVGGVGALLISLWPKAAEAYKQNAPAALDNYSDLARRTIVGNSNLSWLSIALLALAAIGVIVALCVIFSQGGGRTRAASLGPSQTSSGTTTASIDLVQQVIEHEVGDDRWITNISTYGYEVKNEPGILVKVGAYKGASPAHIRQIMDRAIARVDSLLGTTPPICVEIQNDWRSLIGSSDRVR